MRLLKAYYSILGFQTIASLLSTHRMSKLNSETLREVEQADAIAERVAAWLAAGEARAEFLIPGPLDAASLTFTTRLNFTDFVVRLVNIARDFNVSHGFHSRILYIIQDW